jgi:hypothetical protein
MLAGSRSAEPANDDVGDAKVINGSAMCFDDLSALSTIELGRLGRVARHRTDGAAKGNGDDKLRVQCLDLVKTIHSAIPATNPKASAAYTT